MDGKLWIKPTSKLIRLQLLDIIATSGNPFTKQEILVDNKIDALNECTLKVAIKEQTPKEEELKTIVLEELEYIEHGIDIENNYADFAKLKIIASHNYCLLKKIIPLCIQENINVELKDGILVCLPTKLLDSSIIHINNASIYIVDEDTIYQKIKEGE